MKEYSAEIKADPISTHTKNKQEFSLFFWHVLAEIIVNFQYPVRLDIYT
jgi:hypothetical protein